MDKSSTIFVCPFKICKINLAKVSSRSYKNKSTIRCIKPSYLAQLEICQEVYRILYMNSIIKLQQMSKLGLKYRYVKVQIFRIFSGHTGPIGTLEIQFVTLDYHSSPNFPSLH